MSSFYCLYMRLQVLCVRASVLFTLRLAFGERDRD